MAIALNVICLIYLHSFGTSEALEKVLKKMRIRSSWMREDPSVAQVIAGNDVVRHFKLLPIRLKIHAIKKANVRYLLIADSAFDTSGKEKSQFGWLMGFTDNTLNQGARAPVSLMPWRSRRLRRKAALSMSESIVMSAATGALERQDAFMHSIRFSNNSPRLRQKGEDERMDMLGKTSVFAKDVSAFCDPATIVVMDAKVLFATLGQNSPKARTIEQL